MAASASVLVVLLALTGFVWKRAVVADERMLRADFDASVREIGASITSRLQAYEFVVRGVGALFVGSEDVSRAEFRDYVDTLQLEERFPGAQTVGFAQLIPSEKLAEHTRALRRQGFPDYSVHPSGPRETYSPIVLVEPFRGSVRRVLGFDPHSEEIRRTAMRVARKAGKLALSGRVTLVGGDDARTSSGVLIYLPVAMGEPLGDPSRVRRGATGWAYLSVRIEALMEKLRDEHEEDFAFRVYDGPEPRAATLLYDSEPEREFRGRFVGHRTLAAVDRQWTIAVASKPLFEGRLARGTPLAIAVGGSAISVLLAALTWLLLGSRGRALRLAHEMTRSLSDTHDAVRRRRTRDMMRQRGLELELRSNERKYRSLFESSMDAVYLTRVDGGIVDANPAACCLHGMSVEEIKRAGRAGLVVEDPRLTKLIELRRACGHADGELTMVRKDGTTFPAEIDTAAIDAPGADFNAFVIARDITERKRAQLELGRLAAAIEQVPASIVITDPVGVIQYVNPTFERITGYTKAEALGQNPRFLKGGEHDDEFYASMWKTITDGRVWQGRFVNKGKDGRTFREDAVIAPVLDDAGTICNFVAVKRDISEELVLQESLARAQRLESVGRLAGGIAHDFNNILTVILTCAHELRESAVGAEPLLRADIDEILAAGGRAGDLTRQLLSFARRQPLTPVTLDVNQLVSGAERLLRRIIGEDIHLVVSLAKDAWPIRADAGQMEQVILNLAINARDAMPNGGKLLIETTNFVAGDAEAASYPGMSPGEYVRVAVTDYGVGMTADVMSHIFEPFFTTKPAGKGTGLGLATVYGIVNQSGGFLSVESQPGSGSAFYVCLPRSSDSGRPRQEAPKLEKVSGKETILLVEDDALVRNVSARTLQAHGYRVLVANGAARALEIATEEAGRIELLVTDVVMPGKNGKQLAEEFLRTRPDVKLLFVSGYAENAITKDGVVERDVELLPKPFTPHVLARRVRQVLDGAGGSLRAIADHRPT